MQAINLSFSNNILKLSTIEKGQFNGISAEIAPEFLDNSTILNVDELVNVTKDLIGKLTRQRNSQLALNIILETGDVYLKFVTINKKDGDPEDQIIKEIHTKFKDIIIEDVFYSYTKIAPFVYQLVAIKKEILEKYLDLSNKLQIPINCITPWILLLPKFVKINEPAIIISNTQGKQVVALSEFGGIFFSGVFDQEKTNEELQTLVKDLSIYKRTKPISKVFVYNCESFSLNPAYEVLKIEIPNTNNIGSEGYDLHLLLDFMINSEINLLNNYFNFLNLLPLPEVINSKNKSLVLVRNAVVVLILISVVTGGIFFLKNSSKNNPIPVDNSKILGNQIAETSPSNTLPVQNQPQEILKKEDLKIKVENGAGIPGIAGKTKDYLEKAGFKIDDIGNADQTGRATTLLRFKAGKEKYQDLLKEAMKSDFTLEVASDLPSDSQVDLVIIIGTDAKL